MGDGDRGERIKRDVERLLRFMTEEGGAGGTIGPDGLRLGIPNWEERTKHLRLSERVKTHGYPLGFAKSQYSVREGLLETLGERVERMEADEQASYERVRDVMAWALDAERFLGSFNHAGDNRFPIEAVDHVADHLLAWLDHRGFALVPKEAEAWGEP